LEVDFAVLIWAACIHTTDTSKVYIPDKT